MVYNYPIRAIPFETLRRTPLPLWDMQFFANPLHIFYLIFSGTYLPYILFCQPFPLTFIFGFHSHDLKWNSPRMTLPTNPNSVIPIPIQV